MQNKELSIILEENQVDPKVGALLEENFSSFFIQAKEWEQKAQGLIVTSETQVREMKMAREARLALRDIRIEADKKRKYLKEDSLRYGKAVQGVYNVIDFLITPIEKHLEQQEKFVEIQEATRKANLKVQREMDLYPYLEFVPGGLDFANMHEDNFQKILNGAKLLMQQTIENEKKAEIERIAQEKARKEEQERIIQENIRLKKEAEEKEKALEIERAKARKEAEEKEKALEIEKIEEDKKRREEQEKTAKKLAEENKKRKDAEEELARIHLEKENAERLMQEEKERLESAPDKEKILKFLHCLSDCFLDVPVLKGTKYKKVFQSSLKTIGDAIITLEKEVK